MTTPTTRRRRPTRPPTPAAGAPRRVAVYVRRSTDDEHQPFSIDAQLAKLNSYIDSQPGWTLAARFSDDASGATTNRPGLQAALDAAHAGSYDVLLVYRVDRFSRRLTDMMALVEQLDTAGVAFCSATEHFDTSTPMGRMFLQLLGMFAEFERSTIIDRVINGMTAKAGKGKWTGGTRPFGYRVDRDIDRLTPDPHEAPVLREIFGLYVSARLGTRTIASQLNARGLRNRSGKPWSGHNIGRILANRVYLGEVHFRDIVTTDAHPALIDEEIFAAAQRLRDARGDKQTQRAGSDSDYHCTGLITCPRCGHKYVGTSARDKTAATATTPASPAPGTALPAAPRGASTPTTSTLRSCRPSPTPSPAAAGYSPTSSPEPANTTTTTTPTAMPNSPPSRPNSPPHARRSTAT